MLILNTVSKPSRPGGGSQNQHDEENEDEVALKQRVNRAREVAARLELQLLENHVKPRALRDMDRYRKGKVLNVLDPAVKWAGYVPPFLYHWRERLLGIRATAESCSASHDGLGPGAGCVDKAPLSEQTRRQIKDLRVCVHPDKQSREQERQQRAHRAMCAIGEMEASEQGQKRLATIHRRMQRAKDRDETDLFGTVCAELEREDSTSKKMYQKRLAKCKEEEWYQWLHSPTLRSHWVHEDDWKRLHAHYLVEERRKTEIRSRQQETQWMRAADGPWQKWADGPSIDELVFANTPAF